MPTLEVNGRKADHNIDPMFLERWSPRAFTGEVPSEEELMTILEAARWAPSSYNSQPARFIYALKGTAEWDTLFDLLVPFNQEWVKNAGALLFVASNSTMLIPGSDKPVPSHSHSFDAGSAWGYLALQAMRSGWVAHAMTGFDVDRSFATLELPAGYRVEAAVAIGKQGDKSVLPEQMQAREFPNDRKPLSELVFIGKFKA
jgi:nitroreductase